MSNLILRKTGEVVANVPPEQLQYFFARHKLNPDDFSIQRSSAEIKDGVRSDIDRIADSRSREGVMADVLAYFVNAQAAAAVAVAKASTIADIKAAFAEQAKIGQVLLDLMAEGKLVFPYQAKGLDGPAILADLVRVSNGVSGALAQAQKPAA